MRTVLLSHKCKQKSKNQHKLGKLKHNKQMSFVSPYLQALLNRDLEKFMGQHVELVHSQNKQTNSRTSSGLVQVEICSKVGREFSSSLSVQLSQQLSKSQTVFSRKVQLSKTSRQCSFVNLILKINKRPYYKIGMGQKKEDIAFFPFIHFK